MLETDCPMQGLVNLAGKPSSVPMDS